MTTHLNTDTPPIPRPRNRTESLFADAAGPDRNAPAQADSGNVEQMLTASDPDSPVARAERRSPQEHTDGLSYNYGDGTPTPTQRRRADLASAIADPPPVTPLPALVDAPDTSRPRDGTGPAWAPPESDSYSSRVRRMVDRRYQRDGAAMPRPTSSPRRGGRGRPDMRGR